ncbi:MAG: hypothetical protein ACT4PP_13515 [Sporichthyaceae bacterium]
MTQSYSVPQACDRLGEIVAQVRFSDDAVLLTDGGGPVAAAIGFAELQDLRRARDEADIAECMRIKALGGPVLTHEEFMAELEAEDAAAT